MKKKLWVLIIVIAVACLCICATLFTLQAVKKKAVKDAVADIGESLIVDMESHINEQMDRVPQSYTLNLKENKYVPITLDGYLAVNNVVLMEDGSYYCTAQDSALDKYLLL